MSLKNRKGKCKKCGHAWSSHDPSDGTCDHVADDPTKGVCRCGRDVTFAEMMTKPGYEKVRRIAQKRAREIMRRALETTTIIDMLAIAYLQSVLDTGNARRYADHLAPEDHAALDALGTPEELARKITSGEWEKRKEVTP